MNKKRLFIGIKIEISNELKNFIISMKKEFSNEKFKWVDFKNFHITLKFLGDTPENLIPQIDSVLKNIAKNFNKFDLQLKGIGIFKDITNPKVLWIGLEDNKILTNLFNNIDKNLEFLGFKRENRKFSPHLTISRIKYLKNKKALLQKILNNCNKNWNKISIKEFILFESILKKEGPIYIELAKYEL